MIHYTVLPERKLIITSLDGEISEAEVLAHGRRMNEDEKIQPGFRELLDLSKVTSGDMSTSGVIAVVELEEGVRMLGGLTDCAPEHVRIGLTVEAYAVKVEEKLAIPYWRPVE